MFRQFASFAMFVTFVTFVTIVTLWEVFSRLRICLWFTNLLTSHTFCNHATLEYFPAEIDYT